MTAAIVVERARKRLARAHPEARIAGGRVLAEKPYPVIEFTVGDTVVTVREVPREAARVALERIAARMARLRTKPGKETALEGLRALREGRGR